MAQVNGRILYRNNPENFAGLVWRGKRVQDAVTGFWFPEDYAIITPFGERVDSRNYRNNYDYDPKVDS